MKENQREKRDWMLMKPVTRLFKSNPVLRGSHRVEVGTAGLEDFTLTCLSKREVFTLTQVV